MYAYVFSSIIICIFYILGNYESTPAPTASSLTRVVKQSVRLWHTASWRNNRESWIEVKISNNEWRMLMESCAPLSCWHPLDIKQNKVWRKIKVLFYIYSLLTKIPSFFPWLVRDIKILLQQKNLFQTPSNVSGVLIAKCQHKIKINNSGSNLLSRDFYKEKGQRIPM